MKAFEMVELQHSVKITFSKILLLYIEHHMMSKNCLLAYLIKIKVVCVHKRRFSKLKLS